jgi:hypothetical protein
MKKIDETNISGTVGMPIKSGVLSFLQDAIKDSVEMAASISRGANGLTYPDTSNTAIIVQGLADLSTFYYPDHFNLAGIISFNGELFFCPSARFTPTATPVLVYDTQYNNIAADADPVLFTDGNSYNVLQTRRMLVVDGNSGTAGYICDFSAIQVIDERNSQSLTSSSASTINTVNVLGNFNAIAKNSNSTIFATINGFSATGNRVVGYIRVNGNPLTDSGAVSVDFPGGSFHAQVVINTSTPINRGDLIELVVDPNSTTTTISSWSMLLIQSAV